MKYVIDRTKWLRGEGAYYSALLRNEDGKMCCLGQVAKQCGLKPKDIREMSSPMSLDAKPKEKLREKIPWLLNAELINSRSCGAAMNVNDKEGISDAKREARLKEIFAKHGDELEFIN